MKSSTWAEAAYLMVEQYEVKTDCYHKEIPAQIRESGLCGMEALYRTCASIFGALFEIALLDAARAGMDYIAYVDETWLPEGAQDRKNVVEAEEDHLESIKAILMLAQLGGHEVSKEILDIIAVGEMHLNNLRKR